MIQRKKSDLIVAFTATGLLLLLASSIMYFIEADAQPEAFGSIPETLWWGVVTLTTVGYGDVTPITPLGQISDHRKYGIEDTIISMYELISSGANTSSTY